MPVTALIRPTLRAMRWGGVAVSTLPATFLVWHVHSQSQPETAAVATALRVAAIMIAAGLAFTLDDPTEDTTGYAPVSILARRTLRIALAFTPALLFWLALRAYAVGDLPASAGGLPLVSMILEFAAFAGVAYGGATFGARVLSDRLGGLAGAGLVLASTVVLALLPWGEGMLRRVPGTEAAEAVTGWWTALVAASAAAVWRFSAPMKLGSARQRRDREVHGHGRQARVE